MAPQWGDISAFAALLAPPSTTTSVHTDRWSRLGGRHARREPEPRLLHRPSPPPYRSKAKALGIYCHPRTVRKETLETVGASPSRIQSTTEPEEKVRAWIPRRDVDGKHFGGGVPPMDSSTWTPNTQLFATFAMLRTYTSELAWLLLGTPSKPSKHMCFMNTVVLAKQVNII